MLFYLWNCAVVDLFSIIKVISVLKDSIFLIFSNYSSKENISISLSYYRKCFSSTFSHFGWGNSAITSKLSLITFCLFFFWKNCDFASGSSGFKGVTSHCLWSTLLLILFSRLLSRVLFLFQRVLLESRHFLLNYFICYHLYIF